MKKLRIAQVAAASAAILALGAALMAGPAPTSAQGLRVYVGPHHAAFVIASHRHSAWYWRHRRWEREHAWRLRHEHWRWRHDHHWR